MEESKNPPLDTNTVSPTTPVVEEKEINLNTEKKVRSPKRVSKWLVVVVVILSVLFFTVAGYIVYTNILNPAPVTTEDDTDSTEDDSTDDEVCTVDEDCDDTTEEEKDDDTEESSTIEFEGDVISATLPDGWSIVEYFDGDGTESLPEGMNFVGLTALDILNPGDEQVFTLQAVSGIGFVGCPEYPVFEDNGENYMFEQESASIDMGETLNTIDYTDSEYIEFEFLNTTFRRIGKKYFYDTQEGNNYFEPPCVDGLLTLEGLYFEDDDGYKYEAYFYGATEIATESDLLVVDTILPTLQII